MRLLIKTKYMCKINNLNSNSSFTSDTERKRSQNLGGGVIIFKGIWIKSFILSQLFTTEGRKPLRVSLEFVPKMEFVPKAAILHTSRMAWPSWKEHLFESLPHGSDIPSCAGVRGSLHLDIFSPTQISWYG